MHTINPKWIAHFLAAFDMLEESTRLKWFEIITTIDQKAMNLWLQELYMLPADAVALVLQHRIDHEREQARKQALPTSRGSKSGVTSAT